MPTLAGFSLVGTHFHAFKLVDFRILRIQCATYTLNLLGDRIQHRMFQLSVQHLHMDNEILCCSFIVWARSVPNTAPWSSILLIDGLLVVRANFCFRANQRYSSVATWCLNYVNNGGCCFFFGVIKNVERHTHWTLSTGNTTPELWFVLSRMTICYFVLTHSLILVSYTQNIKFHSKHQNVSMFWKYWIFDSTLNFT